MSRLLQSKATLGAHEIYITILYSEAHVMFVATSFINSTISVNYFTSSAILNLANLTKPSIQKIYRLQVIVFTDLKLIWLCFKVA